jgi:hypothetical protein
VNNVKLAVQQVQTSIEVVQDHTLVREIFLHAMILAIKQGT